MRQTRLVLAALILTILGAVGSILHLSRQPAQAQPVDIQSRVVPLDPDAPDRSRFGKLVFRGSLHLTAQAERFGGFSALAWQPSEETLIMMNDRGHWLAVRLQWQDGQLAGAKATSPLTPLPDAKGRPLPPNRARDSESLAVLRNRVIVAFEGRHRLMAHPFRPDESPAAALGRSPSPWTAPDAIDTLERNGGLEAISETADGRVLAFAEKRAEGADRHRGWLLDEAGGVAPVSLATDGPHRPTGLALLPRGDLVMVMRHFSPLSGVSIRLVRIAQEALGADATIAPEPLATFGPRLAIDNFEGITAVAPEGDGPVRLLLVADDNFNALQRTLLMAFDLPNPQGG